jgi:predicted nucleic acid-binding Zn ribbon protein
MSPDVPTALPSKKHCVVCDRDILVQAEQCEFCNAAQRKRPCLVCKQPIPEDARICNGCKKYQNWWRHLTISQLTLSLLISLVAVFPPAITAITYFRDYDSHTYAILTNADANAIDLYVWNTGRKPSAILTCVLNFGDVPIQNAELDPVDRTKVVVPPNGYTTIKLTIPELKKEAKPIPPNTHKELWIEVEESSNPHHVLRIPLPQNLVLDIVKQKQLEGDVIQ